LGPPALAAAVDEDEANVALLPSKTEVKDTIMCEDNEASWEMAPQVHLFGGCVLHRLLLLM